MSFVRCRTCPGRTKGGRTQCWQCEQTELRARQPRKRMGRPKQPADLSPEEIEARFQAALSNLRRSA
jgi:hypothetical protein